MKNKILKIVLGISCVLLVLAGLVQVMSWISDFIFKSQQKYLEINCPKIQQAKSFQNSAEQAEQIVYSLAIEHGVDPDLALRIAESESQFDCTAKNKSSSASGLFQFIKSTWVEQREKYGLDPDLDLRFNCHENAKTAMLIIRDGGLRHWEASKVAWQE